MLESIRLVKPGSLSSARPDALVVGVFTDKKLDPVAKALDGSLGGVIAAGLARPEATGDSGKIIEAHPGSTGPTDKATPRRVLIVGLGKRDSYEVGSLRSVGAALARRLHATKDQRVALALHGALATKKPYKADRAGRCLGEGLGLAGWSDRRYKGKGTSDNGKPLSVSVDCGDAALHAGVERGLGLAASTNLCRALSNTPPNIATCEFMAGEARRMAKEVGLSCRVFAGDDLDKERFVGLINVGKASESKPCLIRLEYTPRAGKKAGKAVKPVVLVGKTMTYDSGGLSLKVNNGMVGMKRDKDGGCAVFGAMHAIATVVKPDRPVVALLAVAENSISDEAYRPDDIITYRNGVSVEVTNTDAEGRLVLADALIWACEQEKPAYIVDLATLTGGVITALGRTYAGLFCEDEALRGRLQRAMDQSGERWWRLPMHEEYREMMKSPIADILNSNPNRMAHPIQGAAFLSYFVEKSVPWAHIDIAGVHAVDSETGPFAKGPTGWGVRLLADLVSA